MSTTLEILAPYLPYGIDLAELAGGYQGRMNGLNQHKANSISFETFVDGQGWVNYHAEPQYILPVLRSFEDLCTLLEDGTVPAVEVAKLVAGHRRWGIGAVAPRIIILRDSSGMEVLIKHMIQPAVGWTIDAYSGRTHQQLLNVCGAYDYLRSKHFAVGLTADQYIRKEVAHAR